MSENTHYIRILRALVSVGELAEDLKGSDLTKVAGEKLSNLHDSAFAGLEALMGGENPPSRCIFKQGADGSIEWASDLTMEELKDCFIRASAYETDALIREGNFTINNTPTMEVTS